MFVSELAVRHRLGVAAVAIYILALVTQRVVAPVIDPDEGRFVGMTSLPMSTAVFYLLAVFSFGFTGDVAARQSMYPSRLFVLPVTTRALTFWPMLFGTASIVVVGLAAQVAPWPQASIHRCGPLRWLSSYWRGSRPSRGCRIRCADCALPRRLAC
jgi:hypothetical protein